jgi:hypothetical protein
MSNVFTIHDFDDDEDLIGHAAEVGVLLDCDEVEAVCPKMEKVKFSRWRR